MGMSTDKTKRPKGNIQKPTMGKKPNRPPKTSETPNKIRSHFCRGILILRLKIFMADMVASLSPCARYFICIQIYAKVI